MRDRVQTLASVILIAAMGGCATSGPLPSPPTPTASPVSFDGNYRGSIKLTSSGVSGGQTNWCDTPPAISLSLQNNAFSYVLAHPNVPRRLKIFAVTNVRGCCRPRRLLQRDKPEWRSSDGRKHFRVALGWPDQRDGLRLCICGRKVVSNRAVLSAHHLPVAVAPFVHGHRLGLACTLARRP